jgi:cyanophycinase-like exopeptidase
MSAARTPPDRKPRHTGSLPRTLVLAALAWSALATVRANAMRQIAPGGTRPAAPGLVVLQDRAFELDEGACARVLAAQLDGPRLSITLKGRSAAPPIDPFARDKRASVPSASIEIDPSVEFAGDRSEIGARVRAASCVTLVGGDYMAWYAVLTPNGKASELGSAVQNAHRSGTIVAGQGAAAAFLARWSLTDRASLQREPRNPRRLEPDVELAGLGLVHDFLVDTSTRTHGSLTSLLDTLTRDSLGLALHLDGEVAWVYDNAARRAWIEGDGSALVFNTAVARRQRDALRTARLSLMRRGDRFDADHRTVPTVDRAFSRTTNVEALHERIGAALDVGDLLRGLSRLDAPAVSVPIELGSDAFRLTLWTDENSRLRPAREGSEFALTEIAFDFVRTPQ